MKNNKFAVLLAITVVALIIAFLTTRQNTPSDSGEKTVLFPDLKNTIDNVGEISIRDNSNSINLVLEDDVWKVRQADNYPALFNKIRQTTIALTELQILSEKTSNPSLYSKLSVEDPDDRDAASKLLTMKDTSGNQLAELIVGKDRVSKTAANRRGLYVRFPAQAQTLLVEGELDISTDPGNWIKKDLIDIETDRIRSIRIEHKNDAEVSLQRSAGQDDLLLSGIPEGKRPQPEYVINRMEGILEDINIDQVKRDGGMELPEDAAVAVVRTFDGLVATIISAAVDETNYTKFSFRYEATASIPEPQPEERDESSAEQTNNDDSSEKESRNVEQEVTELTNKTSGWLYTIPDYKSELFSRKLEDLIEDVPEGENEAGKSDQ